MSERKWQVDTPTHTLCLEVVMRDILCAAEDFSPVVADGVDACLYAEPPEVSLECAGDVGLATGCGVSCGPSAACLPGRPTVTMRMRPACQRRPDCVT